MTINDVTYSSDIEKWIISNLDGWVIADPTPATPTPNTVTSDVTENSATTENTTTENNTGGINPFMTQSELERKANKVITSNECQLFYEETLDMAYLHTNRFNIDDLSKVEARAFIKAVCKWTASNLWNKYNIRVNNEDLEDTYVQSYGGLLYKSALKNLQPFILQKITAMSNITDTDNDDDTWGVM
jgi:hypothetical protein